MRFDIDTSRAKTMATRLQNFLAQNPKPTLSRSSSIEAVARMLGFNNRNEMQARLEAEGPAGAQADPGNASQPAGLENMEPAALKRLIQTGLSTMLAQERNTCAAEIVSTTHSVAGRMDFTDAIGVDGPDGDNPLIMVEEGLIDQINQDPNYAMMLRAALQGSVEFESALDMEFSVPRALARALVNESLDQAAALWEQANPPAEPDDLADWLAAIDAATNALERALLEGEDVTVQTLALSAPIVERFNEPEGRVVADIRKAFIERYGSAPEAYRRPRAAPASQTYYVDVSCWIPANLEVDDGLEHPSILEADILHMATTEVKATSEEGALAIAKEKIERERARMIWGSRPDLGLRNLRWTRGGQGRSAESCCTLNPYRWTYRYNDADDFSADKITG